MIGGLALLVALSVLGELFVSALGLPLPGPVAGMLLLLGGLVARGGPNDGLTRAGDALLRRLPIFFVPAGAGAVLWLSLLRDEWAAITWALVGSTLLGIAATGLVARALLPGETREGDEP